MKHKFFFCVCDCLILCFGDAEPEHISTLMFELNNHKDSFLVLRGSELAQYTYSFLRLRDLQNICTLFFRESGSNTTMSYYVVVRLKFIRES